jgi:hypothetical protein
MNRLIVTILFNCVFLNSHSQTKGEFSATNLFGIIRTNELAGTSLEYEDYSDYSGVNLKCIKANGFLIDYQHSIAKTNWFANFGFENRWLKYQTTLYSNNYKPDDLHHSKELVNLKTQFIRFTVQLGKRVVIIPEKLIWDNGLGLNYSYYKNEQLIKKYSKDLSSMNEGEIDYNIVLDFKNYNQKINFSLNSILKYYPSRNVGISLFSNLTNPIVIGDYRFGVLTKGVTYVENGTVFSTSWKINTTVGRVITKYFTLGLGVTYRIK